MIPCNIQNDLQLNIQQNYNKTQIAPNLSKEKVKNATGSKEVLAVHCFLFCFEQSQGTTSKSELQHTWRSQPFSYSLRF